jgi:hypothetical protein
MDQIIVGLIVAAAAAAVIRRFLKKLNAPTEGGCGGGCCNCASEHKKYCGFPDPGWEKGGSAGSRD